MRLKSVRLTHFRGYRTPTVVPIDEAMTGIVGRNDSGKSTILEAQAIFCETEGAKADKTDMNCFSLAEGAEQFRAGHAREHWWSCASQRRDGICAGRTVWP